MAASSSRRFQGILLCVSFFLGSFLIFSTQLACLRLPIPNVTFEATSGQQKNENSVHRNEYSRFESQLVKKTVYSSKARFLFIAGLGGTGHHGWRVALKSGHVCWPTNFPPLALWHLWFGADEEADGNAENLKKVFQHSAQEVLASDDTSALHCLNTAGGEEESMFSYPNDNHKTHHPNVYTLAKTAEDAGVDLRIVVIHRHPANQLVSLSLNREFMALPEEAHQMSNQGAFLNSQLRLIDPNFYACTPFDSVSEERVMLQAFILDGMEGRSGDELVRAIETYYHASKDDFDAAMEQIRNKTDGKQIEIKIEEMKMYHDYLKEVLCKRRT